MDYKILSVLLLLTTPSVMLPKMSCNQVAIHKKGFNTTFKNFKKKQKASTTKKTLKTPIVHTSLSSINFNQQNATHPLPRKTDKSTLNTFLKVLSAALDIMDDPYLRLFAVVGVIAYARNKK